MGYDNEVNLIFTIDFDLYYKNARLMYVVVVVLFKLFIL